MARYFLGVALILLVGGCATASLVATSGQLGGVQDGPRWGVVKYRSSGIAAERSREKARGIMSRYCAPGRYRVVAVNEGLGDPVVFQGVQYPTNAVRVRFECTR